jgi:hypothetical protein
MLVVAYLPVVRSAIWTWPRPCQYVSAVGYGAVGAGQVVLFVLVFHVEYDLALDRFCPTTKKLGFSSMRKKLDLDEWREPCT